MVPFLYGPYLCFLTTICSELQPSFQTHPTMAISSVTSRFRAIINVNSYNISFNSKHSWYRQPITQHLNIYTSAKSWGKQRPDYTSGALILFAISSGVKVTEAR